MSAKVKEGDKIVVWFSCGAASAVAAWLTIQKYSHLAEITLVNNPVLEEDEDNRRFLLDVSEWLSVEVEPSTNPSFPDASAEKVWTQRKYMSGVAGAPCTKHLKIQARQEWERENYCDHMVLGFTHEEKSRHERFILTERNNVLPVLIEEKLTKEDCYKVLFNFGIKLPRIYGLGYPNANCIGCVKATSPTYWNHVREVHPEVFSRRASLSRELGTRLVRVRGERIFLDELHPDEMGRPMKTLDSIDCGIFCEEALEKETPP